MRRVPPFFPEVLSKWLEDGKDGELAFRSFSGWMIALFWGTFTSSAPWHSAALSAGRVLPGCPHLLEEGAALPSDTKGRVRLPP